MSSKLNEQKVIRHTETFAFNLTNGVMPKGDDQKCIRRVNITKCHEMIVRLITYSGIANAGNITYITCDAAAATAGIIGAFGGAAESSVSPNSTFQVGKSITTLSFGFLVINPGADGDATQPMIPTTSVGEVALTIEFRTYL